MLSRRLSNLANSVGLGARRLAASLKDATEKYSSQVVLSGARRHRVSVRLPAGAGWIRNDGVARRLSEGKPKRVLEKFRLEIGWRRPENEFAFSSRLVAVFKPRIPVSRECGGNADIPARRSRVLQSRRLSTSQSLLTGGHSNCRGSELGGARAESILNHVKEFMQGLAQT